MSSYLSQVGQSGKVELAPQWPISLEKQDPRQWALSYHRGRGKKRAKKGGFDITKPIGKAVDWLKDKKALSKISQYLPIPYSGLITEALKLAGLGKRKKR